MRNITCQYNLLFINFSFVNNIIMDLYIKKLLKQLPFYGKTIQSRIKRFANAKLLSELPIFEKPIKAKIKQLTTKKILQERPFYKQSITKRRIKKIKQSRIITSYHFMMILIFHKMKGHLEGMLKPIK